MHNRSQRDPKKSICPNQPRRIGTEMASYLWLQQTTLEEDQGLVFEFMDELS